MLRTDWGDGRDVDGWGSGTVPETVLPVQLFGHVRGLWQPEKRLMLAVLENALLPLLRNPARRHGRVVERRPLTAEVKAWIASDAQGWPFSFLNICHVLGLDEDALRSALLRQATSEGRDPAELTWDGNGRPPALALGARQPARGRAARPPPPRPSPVRVGPARPARAATPAGPCTSATTRS